MGLTRQYLRWVEARKFGVIGSQCKALSLIRKSNLFRTNEFVCCSASCEDIIFWNLKTCQIIDEIKTSIDYGRESPKSSQIFCLAYNENSNLICSGHYDGSIRLFDYENERENKIIFAGHRGIVSCIAFDEQGLRIASGGKDTEIVLWDVVNGSGMFRLRGHKNSVNQVRFMKDHPWILVSVSNDSFIKFWNLNNQHCFKTLAGHRTEVQSFVIYKNDSRLISSGLDSELKVWNIVFAEEENFKDKLETLKSKRLQRLELIDEDTSLIEKVYDEETDDILLVEEFGSILRKSTEKLINISIDSSERLLICHAKENYAECFKIRNDDEIKIKIKKRLRKERKRRLEDDQETFPISEEKLSEDSNVSDEIERLDLLKTSSKIQTLDLIRNVDSVEYQITFLLLNNSIESYKININPFESKSASLINMSGHRSDIRTVCISSDSLSIVTASSDSVKLWNKSSCRCINTIEEGLQYPLCSSFIPGDKHIVLGTKSGKLQIISLANAEIQSTIDASEVFLPIWSINLLPDLTGIVSGSEDKSIKFWSFDLIPEEDGHSRTLTLNLERTLVCDEGVICTKVSPNSKFIAAALLDSCVKIYFMDTFKFFLSLYGHKFPVLCMDISSDNALIVTGSSDKNIKIWGMDFGDCHRSLFAHDDNITSICFIPKTHQFFSASNDHKIKMWDGDNFEKITTLEGHHKEIRSMAIAPNGRYLVSVSHDKSIRLWEKTNEPLILEEEKELENEKEFRKEIESGAEQHTVVPGEPNDNQEIGMAQKKTTETIKEVEKLIESIDIFEEEAEKLIVYENKMRSYEMKLLNKSVDESISKPIREPINPHLMVHKTDCPYRFMLEVLIRIKSHELEETLLQLPFNYIHRLLVILSELLSRRWHIELACRCVCFLLRANYGQIISSPKMISLMDKIRLQMHQSIDVLEDLIGTNVAGLKSYERIFESRDNVSIFTETFLNNQTNKNKKKKNHIKTAPIMTWN
ncbi:WD repeat-containing POC1 centriolar protein-like protein [Sarcoptes scabiei]|uniref:WD repeat-containing POC1 centriolar protein-like protein n=1 Tax=Sarcoptes scabiei TaxID=52283 RepID=A0A132A8C2_SARSC|nr:WD repeat-containing POC1 centriolar protein-like protein [Sarcoptes scabiei]